MSTDLTPRGIRNANPGNIRRTGIQWLGLAAVQGDPDFCQFVTAEYGIRAMARLLHNYKEDGLSTIRQAIGRWSPQADHNDVAAYVTIVAQHCGIGPDDTTDYDVIMPSLIEAIIQHENGMQPYLVSTIQAGIDLANV